MPVSRQELSCRRTAFSLAVSHERNPSGRRKIPLAGTCIPRKGPHRNFYRQIAHRDHVEFCPLSRGVTLKPLSRPLQPSVRFFHDPLPALSSASLAIGLPPHTAAKAALRAYPVPCQQHEQVRSCLSTGGADVDVSHFSNETPGHVPFGSGVLRCDRPALITVFIGSSLVLTVLSSLAPCPRAASERIPILHRTGISPGMRHCQGASHATVASHALPLGYD